ncbi:hypothetical protein Prum_081910 [Phytohabitans rumicis]|uniref:Uncharacterized protein n=1 Tax=Phytohabitans rumicis TaxID=1076125 RepID=A0A6V8LIS2_9ACTN|nr:hypothetical protein Prum_081910 [Phytohabitans rumicis]
MPQVAGATEHAEQAVQALRVAQDALLSYLASIGLAHDGTAGPDGAWRTGLDAETDRPAQPVPDGAPPPPLGRWWAARVAELTGHGSAAERDESAAADGADLLRRVAAGVKAGDRGRLHRELGGVEAPVGLGLSALAPPVLHRLAGDLLRHRPRAEDLEQLTKQAGPRVRELLPNLPPEVLETQFRRICRVPAEREEGPPPHPADAAVAASVLTGVLLQMLHREPDSLDPTAPEPVESAESHA